MCSKRCINYRLLVFFVSFLVFISCTLPCFNKKAYAFVGVDDAVVAAALAAAAGITFVATDPTVQQALSDFSSKYGYDDFLNSVASAAYKNVDGEFIYPIAAVYAGTVKSFVSDLYTHFCGVGGSFSVPVTVNTSSSDSYVSVANLPSPSASISDYNALADFSFVNDYIKFYNLDGTYKTLSNFHYIFSTTDTTAISYYEIDSNGTKTTRALMGYSNTQGYTYKFCPQSNYNSSVGYWLGCIVIPLLNGSYKNNYWSFSNQGYKYMDFYNSSAGTKTTYYCTDSPPSSTTTENVDGENTTPTTQTETDVANNLSEKVAAGNCAINAGKDNAIDSTQTYTQAQDTVITTTDTDTPVTDTNAGITSIVGLLQSILAKVTAIPTAIANTVVGTGTLSFSAFSGITLADRFPFCIPFDFVKCIKQLVATPKAPVFSVDFSGTALAPAGVISLDFSHFEGIAKVVRWVEFFGFVLGLILITRNLVKG